MNDGSGAHKQSVRRSPFEGSRYNNGNNGNVKLDEEDEDVESPPPPPPPPEGNNEAQRNLFRTSGW